MSFEGMGRGALNYYACRYGTSRLTFRGPAPSLMDPFVVVLGSTETFGPFVPRPYPDLLANALGKTVVNLGIKNAGPDVFLSSPSLIDLMNEADTVLIQLPSAANLSNAFYKVHPRRNDRLLDGTPSLRAAIPHLDLSDVHFTGHFWREVSKTAPTHIMVLVREVQQAWLQRMAKLCAWLDRPPTLVWINAAPLPVQFDLPEHGTGLLTRDLVDQMRPLAREVWDIVPSAEAQADGLSEMVFSPTDAGRARQMLSAASHREVARRLAKLMGQKKDAPRTVREASKRA